MTENPFQQPTFIVLNAPAPIAQAVKALRRRFDPDRAELPVEVTVAGSNGLGLLSPGQDPVEVFKIFDKIISATSPIDVKFGPMRKFPDTSIFFLDITPADEIRTLQQKFAESGILFIESPFPFEPHCTVKLRGDITDKEAESLLSFHLQSPNVTLNTVSIYIHDEAVQQPRLLHRANLGEPML